MRNFNEIKEDIQERQIYIIDNKSPIYPYNFNYALTDEEITNEIFEHIKNLEDETNATGIIHNADNIVIDIEKYKTEDPNEFYYTITVTKKIVLKVNKE